MIVNKILARYKDENVTDYYNEDVRGFTFISTPGHGYLAVGSEDNGYSEALSIACNSNYSYVLDGGIVYLEEDCDANEFLKLNLSN